MAQSHDPMDIMIGASEAAGDSAAAAQHLREGEACRERGDRTGAIASFRKAVHAAPNDARAMFKLAYELDLLGEENEEIALYERASEQRPAPVNVLINLAVLYEDQGDYRSAEKCLRQVLDTNPNHPRARLFYVDVVASKDMYIDEEQDRDLAKRNALYDTPVTDFELTVRARNCLKKMNIRTLGDLLRVTEAELMGYKNFGEASLIEIKQMLNAKNLRLGQGLEEQHRRLRARATDSNKGGGGGNDGILAKSVVELGLSVRARKALQVLGIQTIGDLAARTEAELMGVKNFGSTSLDEVKERLEAFGLGLRELTF
jgi:DNA-directed RNA polymerase subunit alpha